MDQNNEDNKGIGSSDTLKDSGTGVEFQEYRVERDYSPRTPKIIQWVIKYSGGLIKDEKQASFVLLGFVALAIITSLFLVFGGGKNKIKSPKSDIINLPQPQEGFIPR